MEVGMHEAWGYLKSVDWLRIAQITSGFMTPVIAALAVIIATNQYRINRLQYRIALFEKRIAIFNAITRFLSTVIQTGRSPLDRLADLMRDTRECDFLFGPEIRLYIDDLHGHGISLNAAAAHPDQEQPIGTEMNWFAGQFKIAETKFSSYLNFRKP
jgi:hypothetical protein